MANPSLLQGKTPVAYTGAVTSYTVPNAGTVLLKLWGGGAGAGLGATASIGQAFGCATGYTTLTVTVNAGDTLTVYTGGGGGGVSVPDATLTANTGGTGGWPDGGNGGANTSGTYCIGAGGGGSSRVYLNGTLIAVAGAGGGGGAGATQSNGAQSWGGGTAGHPTGFTVQGGTQTAGGPNSTIAASNGASLKGGVGNQSGSTAQSGTYSTNAVGGGGGGGYYGGAGGSNATENQSNISYAGAGGSSYFATGTGFTGGKTVDGNGWSVPGNLQDPDYQAGVGVGAAPAVFSGTYPVQSKPGGNGLVVLNYTVATALPVGKTAVPFTGGTQQFTVPTTGTVLLKLWGGGGGGGLASSTSIGQAFGCAGGYTIVGVNVTAGDTLTVYTGGGGGGVSVPDGTLTANTGGEGGWPDGGNGGANTTGLYCIGAGGGGSSRVYRNGTLVAVAGAGGGGGAGATSSNNPQSWAGGTSGHPTGATASGGTQSAGGVNSANSYFNGASLMGGAGNQWGIAQTGVYSNNAVGGGGGGGYYGGAGGAVAAQNQNNISYTGAGGSSYFSTASGTTGGRTLDGVSYSIPGGIQDPDYQAGIGSGAAPAIFSGSYPVQSSAGGNGLVVLDYGTPTTTLQFGKTTVGYTGAPVDFSVPAQGTLSLKLWAGAGGGALVAPGSPASVKAAATGANGGFATVVVTVNAGDDLQVWVGGGGAGPNITSSGPTGNGGSGGWPDGGFGGANTAGEWANGAGGGGSTRVYHNGALIAIAGAGGGGGSGNTTTTATGFPGHGGGATALPSSGSVTGATTNGGGLNTTGSTGASSENGTVLLGGVGSTTTSNALSGTAAANPAGGGGGGGYYGGAGGGYTVANNINYALPGGGGAAWFGGSGTSAGSSTTGTNAGPGNYTDPDYTPGSGVGVGGAPVTNSGTYPVAGNTGGPGQAVLNFTPAGYLPVGKTVVTSSGSSVSYKTQSAGIISVKLWGGGGGGGLCAPTTSGQALLNATGAHAGFTTFTVSVNSGDTVQIWVGGGGSGATATSSTGGSGGAAGWPDGGMGGANTQALYANGGGGGGSSRLYLNGTLIGVAGGAGGAGAGASVTSGTPGYGGGTQGQPQNLTGVCIGGTQTAGGTNGNSAQNGASLKGGQGNNTGSTTKSGSASTNPAGGGGGGGYFGGAGGGNSSANTNNCSNPGAGGSGYFATTPNISGGSTVAGTSAGAGGNTDPDYGSGAGVGAGPGQFSGTYPVSGGIGNTGRVVLSFTPATNANTFGSIPSVTLTSHPLGGTITGADLPGPTAPIGTVTLSTPMGYAGLLGHATAAFPTAPIALTAPTGGLQVVAVIIVPFQPTNKSIDLSAPAVITSILGVAVGGAPGAIAINPPVGAIFGAAHGGLGGAAVGLSAPQGFAVTGVQGKATGAPPPSAITLSAAAATASVGARTAVSAALPSAITLSAATAVAAVGEGADVPLSTVHVTAPAATTTTSNAVQRPLGTVTVEAPAAKGETPGSAAGALPPAIDLSALTPGPCVVAPPPQALPTIAVSKPDAVAFVGQIGAGALGTVTVSAPVAAAASHLGTPFPAAIQLSPISGASVANGQHVSPSGALKVTLARPVGTYAVSGAASGHLPTTPITLSAVSGATLALSRSESLPTITVAHPTINAPIVGVVGHALGSVSVTPVGVTIFLAVNLDIGWPYSIDTSPVIGTASHVGYMAPAITLSPPAPNVTIPVTAHAALPTVTLVPPLATADGQGETAGSLPPIDVEWTGAGALVGFPLTLSAIPTIEVEAPVGDGGVIANVLGAAFLPIRLNAPVPFSAVQAIVIVPLDNEQSIVLTQPTATAHSQVSVDFDDPLAWTIQVTDLVAEIVGAAAGALAGAAIDIGAIHATGVGGIGIDCALRTITVEAPKTPVQASGALATITLQPVIEIIPAAATGVLPTVSIASPQSPIETGGALPTITILTPPQTPADAAGVLPTIDVLPVLPPHTPAATSGVLPTVTLVAPEAAAKVVIAVAGQLPTITLVAPAASATAAIHFATPPEPLQVDITGAPSASAGGGVHINTGEIWGWIVTDQNSIYGEYGPLGSAHVATDTSAALSTVVVSPIEGSAYSTYVGSISSVDVVPPTFEGATVSVSGRIQPFETAIDLSPPAPTLFYAVTLDVVMPPAIRLTTTPSGLAAALQSVYLIAPQGYADNSEPGKFRFWRSEVSGNAPAALADREIAINEVDGVVFSRDSGGNIQKTPFGALSNGGLTPSRGQNGQMLLGDGSWAAPSTDFTSPVRVSTAKTGSGEYFVLSEGALGVQSVMLPLGAALYRPFFVAKAIEITQIGLEVQGPVAGVVAVGVCSWNIGNRTPVALLAQAQIDVSVAGDRFEPVSLTLAPGWYAAIVGCGLSNSPRVTATAGPVTFGPDLSTVGDAQAPFSGSLSPLPQPNTNAAAALGVVMATLEPA